MNALRRVLRSDRGATMVEYAAMLALIALVCITLVASLGSATSGLFAPLVAKWGAL